MAKTKFEIIDKKEKPYIICDTNVWYEMSAKQRRYNKIIKTVPSILF